MFALLYDAIDVVPQITPATEIVVTQKKEEKPKPVTKVDGDVVIVKAKIISRPFAQVKMNRLDIYTNPAAKADALLAVSDLQFSTNNNNDADISLRGGSPRLTRIYFNDIPIYEAVRGTSVLQTTRSFSIFNTSTVRDVETYATAAPAYFNNNAGGAVRILPDDSGVKETSLQANFAKSTFVYSRPFKDSSKGFIQTYIDYSNLAPLLVVNPDLKSLVEKSQGVSIGVNTLFRPKDGTEFRLYVIGDTENSRHPYDLYDDSNKLSDKKSRNYNLFSFEQSLGSARVKLDVAKTFTDEKIYIGGNNYRNQNQYDYLDLNLAGRLQDKKLSYRIGLGYENFDLESGNGVQSIKRNADYLSYYGFMTWNPNSKFTLGAGYRDYLQNDLHISNSAHLNLSFNIPNSRQNIILAFGRYGAVVLPIRSAQETIDTVRSDQVSLDYKLTMGDNKFTIGVYHKNDTIAGETTKINGVDATITASFNKLELDGVFARSLPYQMIGGEKQNGNEKVDYLIKLKAKYSLAGFQNINLIYTGMSGAYYSKPVSFDEINGPIYGLKNQYQLKDYNSLDFSYIKSFKVRSLKTDPIFYLNVNNLFNTKNQAGVQFNSDYSDYKNRYYVSRTIVMGTLIQF
ncbi:TonB-dependent receptor plug domain-containing protein [Pseudaquidulcibacter saccharophilus]|uniref:TonB-dependent receptor plug domain-containing protein n=1 Tax=Pseudaquidulcibacter saccharophilus TaxID=2831900 RepID=UPI001EFF0DD8|nr:TonB-dependent receptor plug domain-containing protein [Pseudaquidulcibacter saccharophilus]